MNIFWYIPTHGDQRYLGSAQGARAASYDYCRQIAIAADQLGYDGVLLPTGSACLDGWVVASSLFAVTRHLKFLVAIRPALAAPALVARMAATLDQFSNGRVLINVATGGDPIEMQGDGVFHDHDARYRATEEFLIAWREYFATAQTARTVDFEGRHIKIKGGKLRYGSLQKPGPPVWFSGSSAVARRIAAAYADSYLGWGEPPEDVKRKIDEVRAEAAARGRALSFGMRVHVLVRERAEQAWADAERLISRLDDATIAHCAKVFARMDSEGQRRMGALHGGGRARAELEIYPNLWAGVGLARAGAATALVGDPEQVAQRLMQYAQAGVDTFILSGYPHLEESYRFAELVFPHLPRRTRETIGPVTSGPIGATAGGLDTACP